MAKLMKCGDCGSQISRSAKRCPNCGKKITPRYVWIFGGMFAFIVFWTIIVNRPFRRFFYWSK